MIVLATSNVGKLREFRAIGSAAGVRFELPEEYDAPEEDGASYAENAAIKARALWQRYRDLNRRRTVLADDSGLEVDALAGRPGIYSARYGGEGASWQERRASLLHELVLVPARSRSARFRCALHLIDENGCETSVEARYDGEISQSERGERGFSYDAVFVDPETQRTFAELSAAEKNAKSHRARAFAALVGRLGLASSDRDDRI